MDRTDSIAGRRTEILARIGDAADKAGVDAPKLIAVSKVQPDARVRAALDVGQTVFGENRVQEAQGRWGETFAAQREGLELHLVGPLQTNKAKDACALFDVIQTLDREKLARALLKAADATGRMPRLMVQINIGEEPQKAGIAPDALGPFLDRLRSEYGLEPAGLMCIPPVDEPAAPHFWTMERLAKAHGLAQLSMGMSADYETAVAFGATHVRVGSALFGARDYG
ncbi:MAG: YggS family pyridoxal phosphate-dependent enzyme [Pseudomonadota bacterium]